jgi:prepilin-type N-terminal cleavage/methylation domain-containing protein/prepilin-type processing-associated H-X9-DG protein
MSGITQRKGFTLIELLVVIAIIAILIGLLVPAVQKVRDAASRVQCQNNLKQIGVALHNYHSDNKRFPSGSHSALDNYWYWSWLAFILPYMEQTNLYQEATLYAQTQAGGTVTPPWPGGETWWWNPALGAQQTNYRCPADPRGEAETTGNSAAWLSYAGMNPGTAVSFTFYLGNSGTNGGNGTWNYPGAGGVGSFGGSPAATFDGVLYVDSHTRIVDITDGTSNTLLVGERPPSADLNFGWWFAGYGYNGTSTGDVVLGSTEIYYAQSAQLASFNQSTGTATNVSCQASNVGFQPGNANNPCDQLHFWSPHASGGNFLFADGSIHFLTYDLPQSTLQGLATRNGGEVLHPTWD